MKKIFIGLIILTILLNFAVREQDQNTVIIYSSSEQFRGDELQRQLDEKFPDIDSRVMYISTAKSASKLTVEKATTDCDIFLDMETAYIEKFKDNLANIEGLSKLEYMDGLTVEDNENLYATYIRQAGSIVVNEEILEKHNLPAPETYEDLLDPMYKDLIAMPDPKSSGTGFMFYKSLVNERGLEGALEYFDQLEPNIKQFTESGSGPIKLLIQGEVAIGFALTYQAVDEINDGRPFKIIFPPEGSPFSVTGTGVIKGREKNEDVMKVYDFIINEYVLYDKKYFSPEKIFKVQENAVENYPQDVKYADMHGIDDMNEKDYLLSKWRY